MDIVEVNPMLSSAEGDSTVETALDLISSALGNRILLP